MDINTSKVLLWYSSSSRWADGRNKLHFRTISNFPNDTKIRHLLTVCATWMSVASSCLPVLHIRAHRARGVEFFKSFPPQIRRTGMSSCCMAAVLRSRRAAATSTVQGGPPPPPYLTKPCEFFPSYCSAVSTSRKQHILRAGYGQEQVDIFGTEITHTSNPSPCRCPIEF
jgi:hypothetical protein